MVSDVTEGTENGKRRTSPCPGCEHKTDGQSLVTADGQLRLSDSPLTFNQERPFEDVFIFTLKMTHSFIIGIVLLIVSILGILQETIFENYEITLGIKPNIWKSDERKSSIEPKKAA
jgi:hypothetical protein